MKPTAIDIRHASERTGTWMTVAQLLDELGIKRRTWQRWRALGKAPRCHRLPNGALRIKRRDYEIWLDSLAERKAG
uniref:helix-turn-helix transcriptional regulator n=1 Tax=Nonomuraea pusilla TaxID=46177 RepID=UPI0006E26008|nr:helix-turn-helix domain-containing protein [Nonomuraea pusilla]